MTTDPATGQAFVSNPDESTVTVINERTGTVAGIVPTGERDPFVGIAADPHRGIVYVANVFGASVSVLVHCQAPGN